MDILKNYWLICYDSASISENLSNVEKVFID
jgi:predicted Ser/Thr protein kinase